MRALKWLRLLAPAGALIAALIGGTWAFYTYRVARADKILEDTDHAKALNLVTTEYASDHRMVALSTREYIRQSVIVSAEHSAQLDNVMDLFDQAKGCRDDLLCDGGTVTNILGPKSVLIWDDYGYYIGCVIKRQPRYGAGLRFFFNEECRKDKTCPHSGAQPLAAQTCDSYIDAASAAQSATGN